LCVVHCLLCIVCWQLVLCVTLYCMWLAMPSSTLAVGGWQWVVLAAGLQSIVCTFQCLLLLCFECSLLALPSGTVGGSVLYWPLGCLAVTAIVCSPLCVPFNASCCYPAFQCLLLLSNLIAASCFVHCMWLAHMPSSAVCDGVGVGLPSSTLTVGGWQWVARSWVPSYG
jgi:hypothetical protein